MLLPKNWHTLALDQKFAYALALAQERRDARKPECRKTAVVSKAGKVLKPATISCGSTCRQPKNCGLSKAEKQRIQSRVGTDPDALRRAIVVAKRKKRQGQSGTGAVYAATKGALGAAGQSRNEKRKARGEKPRKVKPSDIKLEFQEKLGNTGDLMYENGGVVVVRRPPTKRGSSVYELLAHDGTAMRRFMSASGDEGLASLRAETAAMVNALSGMSQGEQANAVKFQKWNRTTGQFDPSEPVNQKAEAEARSARQRGDTPPSHAEDRDKGMIEASGARVQAYEENLVKPAQQKSTATIPIPKQMPSRPSDRLAQTAPARKEIEALVAGLTPEQMAEVGWLIRMAQNDLRQMEAGKRGKETLTSDQYRFGFENIIDAINRAKAMVGRGDRRDSYLSEGYFGLNPNPFHHPLWDLMGF